MTLQLPLNPAQHELLKMFERKKVTDEDLVQIKRLIARYFAEKAMDLADKVWEEKGWTEEDSIRLANTRMRTPYEKPASK